MEGDEKIEIHAAILTAGYVINTTFDIENIQEVLKIFSRFKKEIKERVASNSESGLAGDIDLIATILTGGYIVNTHSHIERLAETLEILDEIRSVLVQIINKVPESFSERGDLNIVAAILVAGLIVNTTKWEECILETNVLLKECKEELLKLP